MQGNNLKCSIIVASYRPNKKRIEMCREFFDTIHNTGLDRDEYELILIDNGGIHSLWFEDHDYDVLIKNRKNWGQPYAINQGMRLAQSDVIAMMDDDLKFKQDWLKRGLELLEGRDKRIISLRKMGKKEKYTEGRSEDGYRLLSKAGGCWIFPRELIDDFGYFPTDVYSYGGKYTRGIVRAGWRFLLDKKPSIVHLGEKKPIRERSPDVWNKWYNETYENDGTG